MESDTNKETTNRNKSIFDLDEDSDSDDISKSRGNDSSEQYTYSLSAKLNGSTTVTSDLDSTRTILGSNMSLSSSLPLVPASTSAPAKQGRSGTGSRGNSISNVPSESMLPAKKRNRNWSGTGSTSTAAIAPRIEPSVDILLPKKEIEDNPTRDSNIDACFEKPSSSFDEPPNKLYRLQSTTGHKSASKEPNHDSFDRLKSSENNNITENYDLSQQLLDESDEEFTGFDAATNDNSGEFDGFDNRDVATNIMDRLSPEALEAQQQTNELVRNLLAQQSVDKTDDNAQAEVPTSPPHQELEDIKIKQEKEDSLDVFSVTPQESKNTIPEKSPFLEDLDHEDNSASSKVRVEDVYTDSEAELMGEHNLLHTILKKNLMNKKRGEKKKSAYDAPLLPEEKEKFNLPYHFGQ